MKTPNKIHDSTSKFNATNDEYIESTGKLFVNHESLIDIQKILDIYFPIFTQYFDLVETSEGIVESSNEVVEYEYSNIFMRVGSEYIAEDKIKIKLINKNWARKSQLEDMTVDWKTFTLLSFGSSAKILINIFIS